MSCRLLLLNAKILIPCFSNAFNLSYHLAQIGSRRQAWWSKRKTDLSTLQWQECC